MTREILIKSALRTLVNEQVKQGSTGYALEEDSAYEVSWKDVLKWLEQQPSEDWLSTFNTESATECFTAVQQLKETINDRGDAYV